MTQVQKITYTDHGLVYTDSGNKKCLYDEVIKYADNDTDVLPILYAALDDLCHKYLDCNITSFITAGAMSWYGAIIHLP
jgi:hypothetical protein